MRQQSPPVVNPTFHQPKSGFGQGSIGISNYNTSIPADRHFMKLQVEEPEQQQFDDFFDQAEMEKAFEAVSMEQRHAMEVPSPPLDMARDLDGMYQHKRIRIGSDRILDESVEDEEDNKGKKEADELARTAGQLLDNVKHDQSQKFQQSSFLSLMRHLRDREVYVEGDKLVDVSLSHPHS